MSLDPTHTKALVISPEDLSRPVALLIPDVLGSQLARGGELRWPDAAGRFDDLDINSAGISAIALLDAPYAALADFLEASHVVHPFPYDGRQSLAAAADALATVLHDVLAATEQPIRFLAHGAGGIVVQHLMQRHPHLWARCMARAGARLLLLGAPLQGSWRVPLLFSGGDPLLRLLAHLSPDAAPQTAPDIMSRWPGLLELLPEAPDNFLDSATWQALHERFPGQWPLPDGAALEAAASLRRERQGMAFDPQTTVYGAGAAPATPCAIDWQAPGNATAFLATPRGDGQTAWKNSIPPQLAAATWYMDAPQGQLCSHRPAFSALLELLAQGSTALLPQEAPPGGGVRGSFVFQPQEMPPVSGDGGLAWAALGTVLQGEKAPDRPRVRVSITHGNLENARFPVAVGHHAGDGIMSAERVLDFYLEGRLSDRHRAGVYPGEVETAEVVLTPRAHPPGGVVLGLGEFGELSTSRLERSFCHAVIALALKRQEAARSEGPAQEGQDVSAPVRGITPLLIGSGFGGLTLRGALRAMLAGILRANERLAIMGDESLKPLEEVEFIEIYEDRAIHALRALDDILREDRFRGFQLSRPHVRKVAGGRRQLLDEQEADWWHRFKVEGNDEKNPAQTGIRPLRFTSLTGRARAEVSNLPTQRALVDGMIRQSVDNPRWDQTLAQSMFELLIPNAFKDFAADRNNLLWIVDEAAAEYPWELLQDPARGDQEPLAVRAGMLRQLAVPHYRADVRNATGLRAFVVGDPVSEFTELPAARREAAKVSELLEAVHFSVETRLRSHSVDIIKTLFLHNYQVLHLAGHGVVNFPPLGSTGMVLGNGAFLSPEVINQMRAVPEFVFINCCYLGKTDDEAAQFMQDRHQLAANLGTQLIRMGVRAVVAAGWAVDDEAAFTFAETFYHHFLHSVSFGESVRLAREQAYRLHPHTQTWGAYQCYGDPFYTLKGKGKNREAGEKPYYDPLEVIIDLENIGNEAESASSRWFSELRNRLSRIDERIPGAWKNAGHVVEALGNAYAALNLFPEAVAHYESARRLEVANYSVSVLERTGNLKARWGAERYLAPDATHEEREQARTRIAEAIELLQSMLAIGKTAERMNLLGSAHKRLAVVQPDTSIRTGALRLSASYYEKASRLESERNGGGGPDLYDELNRLAIQAVLSWYGSQRPALDADTAAFLEKEESRLERENGSELSFWRLTFPANMREIRLIYEGADQASIHQPIILQHYERAWHYGGSFKKRDSVLQQYRFLTEVLRPPVAWPRGKSGKRRAALDEEMLRLSQVFGEMGAALEKVLWD